MKGFTEKDLVLDGRPFYLVVSSAIMRRIIMGDYKPGDALPTIRDLSTSLRKAPGTIIKAIDHLEEEGIVQKIQGTGTFVTTASRNNAVGVSEKNTAAKNLAEYVKARCIAAGISSEALIEELKK